MARCCQQKVLMWQLIMDFSEAVGVTEHGLGPGLVNTGSCSRTHISCGEVECSVFISLFQQRNRILFSIFIYHPIKTNFVDNYCN